MTIEFTPEGLVAAVKRLFELNHYDVTGPVQIHGAEIDLVARRRSDPFDVPIYMEITIEYVDNDKYGKDVGKLAMLPVVDPGSQRLIISSRGFSLPVQERAQASQIKILTYSDLFSRFEKFDNYLKHIVGDTETGTNLRALNEIYEEPLFVDSLGKDQATLYLRLWRADTNPEHSWLVVVGEYGTGKTALTKVVQYRWLEDYQKDPSLPIPIRIELRDFSRQFDARGLLHHFLDHNNLGHVPIEFVESLIRAKRLILLLDGYDEMAQYLNARERRACLEALAELAAGGAKGILTSRPNYFTEAEELQVFEILYSAVGHGKYFLSREAKILLEVEKRIDNLLESFLNRFERSLKDLDQPQTEALVRRILKDDPEGQQVVMGLLTRTFRSVERGDISLGGKPVIISYLLEVVEDLKRSDAGQSDSTLTEWQIYKIIVDQLMIRDLRRSPELPPDERRRFLHRLSVFLSHRDNPIIREDEFKDLINREFGNDLRRFPQELRAQQVERYFADLRGSSTLTRSSERELSGWKFSHNSLREYLLAEHLIKGLSSHTLIQDEVPISDAMRIFAASLGREDREKLLHLVSHYWGERQYQRGLGQLIALLWDGFLPLFEKSPDPVRTCLRAISGSTADLNEVKLSRIVLSSLAHPASLDDVDFSGSEFTAIDFSAASLIRANFSGSYLEDVVFCESNLTSTVFKGAVVLDADFSGATIESADFRGVKAEDVSILIRDPDKAPGIARLEGVDALGFLRFNGALTESVPREAVLRHHPKYQIVEKILDRLSEQRVHQRRGLAQRGEARQDVTFARSLVASLEGEGLILSPKHRRDLVEVTEQGRDIIGRFAKSRILPESVVNLLENDGKTGRLREE